MPETGFVINSLPQHVVIANQILLFKAYPKFKLIVPLAIDRAIREIITAVVERSVTISCLTTREMVTKDFAMEPDENVLKKAAQLMVSSLAGSLAVVTCRDPLRTSTHTHLRQLFAAQPNLLDGVLKCIATEKQRQPLDKDGKKIHERYRYDVEDPGKYLDHVLHDVTEDNLNLGCSLIEKAVVDKSLKEIEEHMAGPI
jgi:CCR4-NOT transcription complex subunit 1